MVWSWNGLVAVMRSWGILSPMSKPEVAVDDAWETVDDDDIIVAYDEREWGAPLVIADFDPDRDEPDAVALPLTHKDVN